MARLEFNGQSTTQTDEIRALLADHGVPYESWGVRTAATASDDEILAAYAGDIDKLKQERNYVTADLVALSQELPNLDEICAKFDKEHHHAADEVRFTVAGAGVFEIKEKSGNAMMKLTTEPGDLIVIPANRRHLFYLTDEKNIRCIRLFKDAAGWEAIY